MKKGIRTSPKVIPFLRDVFLKSGKGSYDDRANVVPSLALRNQQVGRDALVQQTLQDAVELLGAVHFLADLFTGAKTNHTPTPTAPHR